MKKLKFYLKNQYQKAKKYFIARQPQFLFLSVLLVFFFYLKQTAYFANVLNVQRITFVIWPIAILTLELKGRVSFKMVLLFLLLCPILIILNVPGWTPERAADYAYGFLLIGIIQEAIGYLKK